MGYTGDAVSFAEVTTKASVFPEYERPKRQRNQANQTGLFISYNVTFSDSDEDADNLPFLQPDVIAEVDLDTVSASDTVNSYYPITLPQPGFRFSSPVPKLRVTTAT